MLYIFICNEFLSTLAFSVSVISRCVMPALYQYLHSTGTHEFNQPIRGQREVCAVTHASEANRWQAMEGLYIKGQ